MACDTNAVCRRSSDAVATTSSGYDLLTVALQPPAVLITLSFSGRGVCPFEEYPKDPWKPIQIGDSTKPGKLHTGVAAKRTLVRIDG
jgi:hypothetical protein